jgi:hypothetical protein
MVGVVATESGGRSDAVQPNGMGRGLVQIDLGQHPEVTEAQAFDPVFAMTWALNASKGSPGLLTAPLFYGPRDRPADATAARREAMASNPEAASPAAIGTPSKSNWQKLADAIWATSPAGGLPKDPGGLPGASLGSIYDAVKAIPTAAAWAAKPHNWLRVVEVILGAALVLAGLWHLSPGLTAPVTGAAKKAAGLVAVA